MRELSDLIRVRYGDTLSQTEGEAAKRLWDEAYPRNLMRLRAGESAKIRAAFLNEIAEQARVSQLLSLISPAAAYVFLTSDHADTGLENEWGFRRAIFSYRRQYAEYVDRYIDRTGNKDRLWRVNKEDSPPFDYRDLTPLQATAAHLSQFMVLAIHSVLSFLGAQMAFIRSQL